MQNILIMTDRKRRSEPLSKEEHKALLKYISTFPTKLDAAYAIGISRQVLDLVAIRGTGSPDSIRAIREKLSDSSKAA
jgi:hypothetical protein